MTSYDWLYDWTPAITIGALLLLAVVLFAYALFYKDKKEPQGTTSKPPSDPEATRWFWEEEA